LFFACLIYSAIPRVLTLLFKLFSAMCVLFHDFMYIASVTGSHLTSYCLPLSYKWWVQAKSDL
jgi:hypothetical protein